MSNRDTPTEPQQEEHLRFHHHHERAIIPEADDAQIQAWKREQYEVASKVVIHPDEQEAEAVNEKFKRLVLSQPPPFVNSEGDDNGDTEYYGGVDVSFPTNQDTHPSVATYVICSGRDGTVVYRDHTYFSLTVPYVSSFLAFREIEPLEALVRRQLQHAPRWTPHAILVDGNGYLHARRAGIACFLGV